MKGPASHSGRMTLRCGFMICQTASLRGVTLPINKCFFCFSYTTVIGLDINFPKYPACEAGGFIDCSVLNSNLN